MHNIAIKRMDECIDADNAYNEWIGYYGNCATPRERPYEHNGRPCERARKRARLETAVRKTGARRKRRILVTTGKKKGGHKKK